MFSDSRASMPDRGFRMEILGHLIGVKDAGRRTNQRAADAAPSAQMEPNMLTARQNNDSQPDANAPICSRAILIFSSKSRQASTRLRRQASGSSDDAAFVCFGLRDRWRTEITTLRHYDEGRGFAAMDGWPVWARRPQTMRACLSSNQSTAGREANSGSRRYVTTGRGRHSSGRANVGINLG
jgi:hypothetical protein